MIVPVAGDGFGCRPFLCRIFLMERSAERHTRAESARLHKPPDNAAVLAYFTVIVIVIVGLVISNFAFFHSGGPILAGGSLDVPVGSLGLPYQ